MSTGLSETPLLLHRHVHQLKIRGELFVTCLPLIHETHPFCTVCRPATRPRCTCIHVFEPDRPWERTTYAIEPSAECGCLDSMWYLTCFSFDSQHASDVARLLWHPTGIRLLSVDTCCQCKVWEQEVGNGLALLCRKELLPMFVYMLSFNWIQQGCSLIH